MKSKVIKANRSVKSSKLSPKPKNHKKRLKALKHKSTIPLNQARRPFMANARELIGNDIVKSLKALDMDKDFNDAIWN